METQSECIENLRKKGFTEEFVSERSFCVRSKKVYRPHEVKVSGFYQYPGDQTDASYSVLMALETIDGKKGILVARSGENLDKQISEFIHVVTLARRRNKKYKFLLPMQWFFKFKFSVNL
jgi:hypothetical protein